MSVSGPAVASPLPQECEGLVISGKYVIRRQLGAGSMGAVYEAENVAIKRHVAIKILSPEYAHRVESVGRFEREAQAAAQIGHPHIVDVLDMGRTEAGIPYMVMELLDGEDLRTCLGTEGPLRPGVAVDIVIQVLGALGAAHAAGIVHRDLKPENVFLVRKGLRNDFVKVIDFGVAKVHDPAGSSAAGTRDGLAIGTPWYMSPEQARGRRTVDARSDLYSVGVLLYEMLSGCLPYPGESAGDVIVAIATENPPPLGSIVDHLPSKLSSVVMRAMSRDPADRYQTAEEFIAALEPFGEAIELEVSDVHSTVVPASSALPAAPARSLPTAILDDRVSTIDEAPAGLRTSLRWAAVAGTLALAAGIVVVAWLWTTDPDPARQPPAATEPTAQPFVGQSRVVAPSSQNVRPPIPVPDPAPPDAVSPSTPPSETPGNDGAAPPAPAPAATIHLEVRSNVPGARVLLDGSLVGTTPLRTDVARATGSHTLRVEADGYLPRTRRVRLVSETKVDLELRRVRPKQHPPIKPPRPPGGADGTFDPFGR